MSSTISIGGSHAEASLYAFAAPSIDLFGSQMIKLLYRLFSGQVLKTKRRRGNKK